MRLHASLHHQKERKTLGVSLFLTFLFFFFFFILHLPPSLNMTVSLSLTGSPHAHSLSIDSGTYSVAECQATTQLYHCLAVIGVWKHCHAP